MHQGNIYESIPDNLDTEVFENIIQNNNVKIERILSKGHRSPESGWYDQEHNEWVIVLKGEALVHCEEGREIHLQEGSYITIPAHTRHKVSWTHPERETIWLAVHY